MQMLTRISIFKDEQRVCNGALGFERAGHWFLKRILDLIGTDSLLAQLIQINNTVGNDVIRVLSIIMNVYLVTTLSRPAPPTGWASIGPDIITSVAKQACTANGTFPNTNQKSTAVYDICNFQYLGASTLFPSYLRRHHYATSRGLSQSAPGELERLYH